MACVALNSAINGIDLDRVHEVVGKIDHHSQTEEEQRDGATDSEPRVVLSSFTGLNADGEEACRAVDEGCYEPAEDHLGRTITEEIAQQPR